LVDQCLLYFDLHLLAALPIAKLNEVGQYPTVSSSRLHQIKATPQIERHLVRYTIWKEAPHSDLQGLIPDTIRTFRLLQARYDYHGAWPHHSVKMTEPINDQAFLVRNHSYQSLDYQADN
jgi:hypothetical protein